MSLDQFSSAAFDASPYIPRNNSYDTSMTARIRGHTFSSSLSSEPDLQDMRTALQVPETIPRIPARNSMRFQKNIHRLPSIFGEDEDSVRSRVYDSQRAVQPGPHRRKKHMHGGSMSPASSASSSIELGHLASLSGRLGGAGDRRSRSFDFGSRQRDIRTSNDPMADGGATMPSVFQGAEAQIATAANASASPLMRKNSAKSSKSAYAKRGRMGTLGTSSVRPTSDFVPQLPSVRSVPALNNTGHDQKSVLQDTVVAPRPGFFRRVFGSARHPAVSADAHLPTASIRQQQQHGRSTPVQGEIAHPSTPPSRTQRPTRRPSNDVSANKENQPVVSKKSSTFFRRRKKSISANIPPPLPLKLNSEVKPEPAPVDGTSPVSSLRAFMDPYLAESPMVVAAHSRSNSLQGFRTPTLPPPTFGLIQDIPNRAQLTGHRRTESRGSSRTLKSTLKPASTLRIPHQDSFLADSSSTEEASRLSPFDGSQHSDSELPDSHGRRSANDLKLERAITFSTLPSPSVDPKKSAARRPSWSSEKVSPTSPLVRNPLFTTHDMGRANRSSHSASALKQLEADQNKSKSSPLASTSDISEYRSAPTTPMGVETSKAETAASSSFLAPQSNEIRTLEDGYKIRAQQIFDNADVEIDSTSAGAWLGEAGIEREHVRKAYMGLFDWSGQNLLDAFRGLCDRIALKGETQQMDRVVDAFAQRWCECNTSHMFRSSGKFSV